MAFILQKNVVLLISIQFIVASSEVIVLKWDKKSYDLSTFLLNLNGGFPWNSIHKTRVNIKTDVVSSIVNFTQS